MFMCLDNHMIQDEQDGLSQGYYCLCRLIYFLMNSEMVSLSHRCVKVKKKINVSDQENTKLCYIVLAQKPKPQITLFSSSETWSGMISYNVEEMC